MIYFFSGEIVGALNVSQNDLTWLANSKNAQMWLRGVLHFKNLDSITLRFNFDTLPLFKVGLHMLINAYFILYSSEYN